MERTFFVLVPVYKAEKFIDACIQSVLAQTYGDFRLILVDDGTPDRSGEICDTYAQKDPRITVIHKENGGQNSARNAAIDRMLQEATESDFAVFLDSDDALRPQTLQVLNDTISQSGCDMVVYGFDRVLDGKVLSHCHKSFLGEPKSRRELYHVVFFDSGCNSLCRKSVSKALVRKMREGYQSRYDYIRLGEDLLQSIPLYEHCEKAVFIPDDLYAYTLNPESISSNRAANRDFLESTVRQLVLEFLERQPQWTREDMDIYLGFCRKLLVNRLLHVEDTHGSKREKTRLFEAIKEDAYYRRILQTATDRDVLLNLLKQNQYGRLRLCLKAYNLAVYGKQLARKLLAR